MSEKDSGTPDPIEMFRQMWSGAGIPLPGMVAPTLDIEDLEKRITDLKTVENWLRMNLNMLQATIQGLEVQCSTLTALKAMSEQAAAMQTKGGPSAGDNPFAAAAAMWPWNLMNAAHSTTPETKSETATPPPPPAPKPGRKPK